MGDACVTRYLWMMIDRRAWKVESRHWERPRRDFMLSPLLSPCSCTVAAEPQSGVCDQGSSSENPPSPLLSSLSGGLLGSRSGSRLGFGRRVGERIASQTGVVIDPGNVADDAAEERAGFDRQVVCTSRLRRVRRDRKQWDQARKAKGFLRTAFFLSTSPRHAELHPTGSHPVTQRDRAHAYSVANIPEPDVLLRQGRQAHPSAESEHAALGPLFLWLFPALIAVMSTSMKLSGVHV